MATASDSYHEDPELLQQATMERHRAIVSLQEECEAVDWYDQRIDAAVDPELAAVLAHNRDEEKEHAAMTLEWLRRHDPVWDQQLRQYLFTERPILEVEEEAEQPGNGNGSAGEATAAAPAPAGAGDLGIRSLRGEPML